jgi:hypothetical protein
MAGGHGPACRGGVPPPGLGCLLEAAHAWDLHSAVRGCTGERGGCSHACVHGYLCRVGKGEARRCQAKYQFVASQLLCYNCLAEPVMVSHRNVPLERACRPLMVAQYGEEAVEAMEESGLMKNPIFLMVNPKWEETAVGE